MPTVTALIGRDAERDRLRAALADAAAGAPSALAVRGDPGVGKTRLLDDVVADPLVADAGFRVIRVAGHEAESEIPYAALSLLLGPLLDGIPALPRPQAAALEGALNLGPGGGRPARRRRRDAGAARPHGGGAAPAAGRRRRPQPGPAHARGPGVLGAADARRADRRAGHGAVAGRHLARGGALAGGAAGAARRRSRPRGGPAAARVVDAAVARDLGGHGRQPAGAAGAAGGRGVPAAGRARPAQHPAGARLRAAPLGSARGDPPRAAAGRRRRQRRRRRRRGAGRAGSRRSATSNRPRPPTSSGATTATTGPAAPACTSATRSSAARSTTRPRRAGNARHTGRSPRCTAAAPGPGAAERRAFHLAAAAPGTDEDVAAQLTAAARGAAARNNHVTALALLERAARLSPSGPARIRRLLEAALTAQTAGNVAAATPLLDLALMETDDPALITTACHLQCRVQMWSGQPIEARDELLDLAGADPRGRPGAGGGDAQPGRAAEPDDRRPAPRPRRGERGRRGRGRPAAGGPAADRARPRPGPGARQRHRRGAGAARRVRAPAGGVGSADDRPAARRRGQHLRLGGGAGGGAAVAGGGCAQHPRRPGPSGCCRSCSRIWPRPAGATATGPPR